MRRFRQLAEVDEKCRAMKDAHDWGYPRKIHVSETHVCAWFRFGPDVIFWLEPVEVIDMTCVLHLIVAPMSQRRHYAAARTLFRGIDVIADLFCLERLLSGDCEAGGKVASYLGRLGWAPYETDLLEGEWMSRELGSFDYYGEQTPQAEDHPPSERR